MTFSQAIQKKMLKKFSGIIPSVEDNYAHPTFFIDNLADYIRVIAAISAINKDLLCGYSVVYRGMVDYEYPLIPGLARIEEKDSDIEATLINDFLNRRPDAFNGLSEFDTLAKMQHYGLPTRLLDFSLNPLVALYFACESKTTKSGRVLCHNTFLQNDSSEYVSSICATPMTKMFDDNYTVEEYYCNDSLTLKKYISESYIYDETTVVRPKYWNQRIANQSGAFMVFSNKLIDRYKYILIHESELGLDKAIEEYARGRINRNAIEVALNTEPIDFYIKESKDYLTDECFYEMYNSYKNYDNSSIWDLFKNRFTISDEIKPLSQTKIKNRFCSIIIESKNKRRILQDLSYIGFRADYIYPELEYTAKEIKRRYK